MNNPIDEIRARERRAPVQGDTGWHLPRRHPNAKPPGTIAWSEHVAAWERYAARYGRGQSAERLAERSGFSYGELVDLLGREPLTWEPLR